MTSWIITIPDHLKTQEMCNEVVHMKPLSLAYVPDRFKTQEMCDEAVRNKPCMMFFVPEHFKTREMCNEIMGTMSEAFHHIPDHFKTQGMCKKAVEVDPSSLQFFPDNLKVQGMCDKTVWDDSSSLQNIPDWFVTREGVYMWYDDYCDDYGDYWVTESDDQNKFFKWYDGYKKRRLRRHKLRKNFCPLLGIHQDGGIDVCQKTRKKKLC